MAKRCRSCCTAAACGTACVTVTGCNDGYNGGAARFPVPWAVVTLTGPSAFSATAPVVTSVTGATVKVGGTGYTSAPAVTISGGGGAGATATATVSGGHVASVTIVDGGSGFTSMPTISLAGGGGSGAIVLPTLASKVCIPTTGNGTYSYSVAADRFATATGTLSIAGCGTTNLGVQMVVASTHACVPNCFRPLPKTLYVTNSVGAAMAMSYSAGLWATANTPFAATVTSLNGATGQCFAPHAGDADAFFWFRPAVNGSTYQDATSYSSNFAVLDCCLYGPGAVSNFLDRTAAGGFLGGTQVSVVQGGCSYPLNQTFTLAGTYATTCGNSLATPGGTSHTVTE